MTEYGRIWFFNKNNEPMGEIVIIKETTEEILDKHCKTFINTFGYDSAFVMYGAKSWVVK